MVCCVTGHRPNGFPFPREKNAKQYENYLYRLRREMELLYNKGYRSFYFGMAEGADLDFAEAVLDFRAGEKVAVTLHAALPYPARPHIRETKYNVKRDEILAQSDYVYVVSPQYDRGCMQRRNCYMVDHSDLVLAIWNGKEMGGTWNTIKYARSKGKNIRYIMLNEICEK